MTPPADETVPLRVQIGVYALGAFANSGPVIVWVVVPLWMISIDASPFMIGVAIGARSLLPVLLSIAGGAAMDRLGVRRISLFFALLGLVTTALFPLLPWVWAVIVLQIIGGLANAMGWIGAQALIGTNMRSHPVYAGRLAFNLRLAVLAGPMLAGAAWDLLGPWGGFGLLTLWFALQFAAAALLPDTGAPTAEAAPLSAADLMPNPRDYVDAFRLIAKPAILFVIVVSLLRTSSAGIQGSFYTVYLESIGYVGTLIGVLIGSSQILGTAGTLMAATFARHFRSHWVMLVACTVAIAMITITPLLVSFWALMMASMLAGGGSGMSQPLMISLTQAAAGPEHQGKAAALRTTANRLGQGVIPIVMGIVVEFVGLRSGFLIVGGTLLLLMAAVALRVHQSPAFGR